MSKSTKDDIYTARLVHKSGNLGQITISKNGTPEETFPIPPGDGYLELANNWLHQKGWTANEWVHDGPFLCNSVLEPLF